MAEPPPEELAKLIAELEHRSYTTYKCRVQAHRRLLRLNNYWNSSLIAFSTSTTVASVGLLVDKNMYGHGGEVLMVALAILSLVASLVVSSVGYGNRAKAMETNYKEIQQISVRAEALKVSRGSDLWQEYQTLQREYAASVNSSENHTSGDHRRFDASTQTTTTRKALDRAHVAFPAITLLLPAALLIPFAMWFTAK